MLPVQAFFNIRYQNPWFPFPLKNDKQLQINVVFRLDMLDLNRQ